MGKVYELADHRWARGLEQRNYVGQIYFFRAELAPLNPSIPLKITFPRLKANVFLRLEAILKRKHLKKRFGRSEYRLRLPLLKTLLTVRYDFSSITIQKELYHYLWIAIAVPSEFYSNDKLNSSVVYLRDLLALIEAEFEIKPKYANTPLPELLAKIV